MPSLLAYFQGITIEGIVHSFGCQATIKLYIPYVSSQHPTMFSSSKARKGRKIGSDPSATTTSPQKPKRFGSLQKRNKSTSPTRSIPKVNSTDSLLLNGKEVVVPLLPLEEKCFVQNGAPISTLTWFEGDHTTAAQVLEHKMDAILAVNPWLAGKIRTTSGRPTLVHPESVEGNNSNSSNLDHYLKKSSLHRFVQVDDKADLCKNFLVQNSPKHKVWKVTVVPSCEFPDQSFAVVHSMSHCIGDVFTYYSIHNMLLGTQEIKPLRVERSQNKSVCQKDYCLLDSAGFLKEKATSVLSSSSKKIKKRYFLVDNQALQQEMAATVHDPFSAPVPANNVLASWFFRQSECNYGLLFLTMRNNHNGSNSNNASDAAGNYQNTLFCYPDDYSSPAALQRASNRGDSGPFVSDHAKGKFSLLSNWASFAQDASLPDCREELHVPLFRRGKHPISSNNSSAGIIFRAGPGKLAMYVVGNPKVMEGLEHASFEACEL